MHLGLEPPCPSRFCGLLTCLLCPQFSPECLPLPSFCSSQRGPHFTSSSQPQHELQFSIFASHQHFLLLWKPRGSSGRRGSLGAKSLLALEWEGAGGRPGWGEEKRRDERAQDPNPASSWWRKGLLHSLHERKARQGESSPVPGWLSSCIFPTVEQKEAEWAAPVLREPSSQAACNLSLICHGGS